MPVLRETTHGNLHNSWTVINPLIKQVRKKYGQSGFKVKVNFKKDTSMSVLKILTGIDLHLKKVSDFIQSISSENWIMKL